MYFHEAFKIKNVLRLITKFFKFHLFYFTILFASCQSEQIQWIEGLDYEKKGSKSPTIPSELDRHLAYFNKYPEDTLRNFTLLKKSIKTALNEENEELVFKIIILGIQKYPNIMYEVDFFNIVHDFYTNILKEETTATWISGIVTEKWSKDLKLNHFMTLYHKIKIEIPDLSTYQYSEELVNMAKSHSLFFPDKEESALFLWKSYEIMLQMGSKSEALSLLDLIMVRHKKWENIKLVKKEREKLILHNQLSKRHEKEKPSLDASKRNQAPVS